MNDTILVIGATGSVGFEVAKRLSEQDLNVKIAARDPEKAKSIKLSGVEYVPFEYLKPETFEMAFKGVNKVLLVSPPSYLNLHEKVIDAINSAIRNGVKHIVNISAISVDTELDKPMKMIKEYIQNCGVDYVVLCPNCYMQNFKDLFRDLIIAENQITVPTDNAKTSFVDIRDVAEVSVKALTDDSLKNKTYKLTGKQMLNMHVVAHLFTEGLKKDINYKSISPELFEKRLTSAGWPASTIEGTMQLCTHVKNGDTAVVSNDIEKILGREPIKFEKFIDDYSSNWT